MKRHIEILAISLFCLFFLQACAAADYPKEVLIPIKCDIPKREKHSFDKSAIVDSLKSLLIYTEGIETDLAFCRGEETKSEGK